jgi:hypothetical protein
LVTSKVVVPCTKVVGLGQKVVNSVEMVVVTKTTEVVVDSVLAGATVAVSVSVLVVDDQAAALATRRADAAMEKRIVTEACGNCF